jgi:hypothetical protein
MTSRQLLRDTRRDSITRLVVLAVATLMLTGCSTLNPLEAFILAIVAVDYVLRAAVVVALVIMALRGFKALSQNDKLPPNTILRIVIVVGLCVSGTSALIQWHSGKRERERSEEKQALRQRQAVEREAARLPSPVNSERKAVIARWEAARDAARDKWRADVVAAGATGAPGVVPPWLATQVKDNNLTVTNRGRWTVELRASRRSAADGPRCWYDHANRVSIAAGASHRFQMFKTGNEESCRQGALEIHLGHELDSGPAFWTDSALVEFDRERGYEAHARRADPLRESVATAGASVEVLKMQILAYEASAADAARVERYRAAMKGLTSKE